MNGTTGDRRSAWMATALYAAVVAWGAVHHEPWRDEVVPLSIVRDSGSLTALIDALRHEGHPPLWYLVLWAGSAVAGGTWVLKAASAAAAIGAMFLLHRGPLPWWIRWPFTFSFFPLYQYSVVSRGYGLEMLCLFAYCALYPARYRRPVALALVLAALANTEAFGFLMALAAVAMLAVEWMLGCSAWRQTAAGLRALAAALLLAGVAVAIGVAYPAPDHPLARFGDSLTAAVGAALLQPAGHLGWFAVFPWPSVWLWAYLAYLAPRPAVLAFALGGFVGIETLFNYVYGPGAPWHVGNLVLLLVAVAWLDASGATSTLPLPASVARVRAWGGRVLAAALLVLLADQVVMAVQSLARDGRHANSANRSLAALLAADPALATAIITGEPDAPLWSLPYYSDARIYLPREGRFRRWGTFGAGRTRDYDLASLLTAARRVRDECACPVVITIGWPLDTLGTFANAPRTYAEEHFTVTAGAREAFLAATRHLARLGPTITDENYDVYLLR